MSRYIKDKDYRYDIISWVVLMLFGIWKGGLVFSIVATVLLLIVVLIRHIFTKEVNDADMDKK